MSLIGAYWTRICEPLDGFLWHKDITHPLIRPLIRNGILAAGACILAGGALYLVFPWLFWCGLGIAFMTWIFWSWARFFIPRAEASLFNGRLGSALIRVAGRMALFAVLLFIALGPFHAPVSAILAGLVAGSFLGLGTFAWKVFHDGAA